MDKTLADYNDSPQSMNETEKNDRDIRDDVQLSLEAGEKATDLENAKSVSEKLSIINQAFAEKIPTVKGNKTGEGRTDQAQLEVGFTLVNGEEMEMYQKDFLSILESVFEATEGINNDEIAARLAAYTYATGVDIHYYRDINGQRYRILAGQILRDRAGEEYKNLQIPFKPAKGAQVIPPVVGVVEKLININPEDIEAEKYLQLKNLTNKASLVLDMVDIANLDPNDSDDREILDSINALKNTANGLARKYNIEIDDTFNILKSLENHLEQVEVSLKEKYPDMFSGDLTRQNKIVLDLLTKDRAVIEMFVTAPERAREIYPNYNHQVIFDFLDRVKGNITAKLEHKDIHKPR